MALIGGFRLVLNQSDVFSHQAFAVDVAFKFHCPPWTQVLAVFQFVCVDHDVWGITPIVQKSISFVGEPSFNRCLHPLDSFLLVLLFQVALQTGLFNVVPVLSGLAD